MVGFNDCLFSEEFTGILGVAVTPKRLVRYSEHGSAGTSLQQVAYRDMFF